MATDTPLSTNRRNFLRASGGAAVTLGGLSTVPAATAQSDESDAFDEWFDGVENYDGVVDQTGTDEVSITVGAAGNGGAFAYGPAAVRVDPGTTVTWTWTGEGGGHDVVDESGAYASELLSSSGDTFTHTFDETGVSYYACTPHKVMGMRGSVVVGDVLVGGGTTDYPEPEFGDWFDGVSNFDGTLDATGVDEVRVEVGAEGNGGNLAFEPAAVRVDPGTTVVWEWVTESDHSVVAEDDSYASPDGEDASQLFAMEFEGDGISKYSCETFGDDGMRGAIVVGAGGETLTQPTALGWAVGGIVASVLASPLLYGLYVHIDETTGQKRAIANAVERERNL